MNHEFSNEEHGNRSHHKGLRSPKRITITVPYAAYQNLLERSDLEGRSLREALNNPADCPSQGLRLMPLA